MSYEDEICKAIEIIAKKRVNEAGYNKIIYGEIIEVPPDKNPAYPNRYKVKDGEGVFYAYSPVPYLLGTRVAVLIPNNNMGKAKIIIGCEDNDGWKRYYLRGGGSSSSGVQTISINRGTPIQPSSGNIDIPVPTKIGDLAGASALTNRITSAETEIKKNENNISTLSEKTNTSITRLDDSLIATNGEVEAAKSDITRINDMVTGTIATKIENAETTITALNNSLSAANGEIEKVTAHTVAIEQKLPEIEQKVGLNSDSIENLAADYSSLLYEQDELKKTVNRIEPIVDATDLNVDKLIKDVSDLNRDLDIAEASISSITNDIEGEVKPRISNAETSIAAINTTLGTFAKLPIVEYNINDLLTVNDGGYLQPSGLTTGNIVTGDSSLISEKDLLVLNDANELQSSGIHTDDLALIDKDNFSLGDTLITQNQNNKLITTDITLESLVKFNDNVRGGGNLYSVNEASNLYDTGIPIDHLLKILPNAAGNKVLYFNSETKDLEESSKDISKVLVSPDTYSLNHIFTIDDTSAIVDTDISLDDLILRYNSNFDSDTLISFNEANRIYDTHIALSSLALIPDNADGGKLLTISTEDTSDVHLAETDLDIDSILSKPSDTLGNRFVMLSKTRGEVVESEYGQNDFVRGITIGEQTYNTIKDGLVKIPECIQGISIGESTYKTIENGVVTIPDAKKRTIVTDNTSLTCEDGYSMICEYTQGKSDASSFAINLMKLGKYGEIKVMARPSYNGNKIILPKTVIQSGMSIWYMGDEIEQDRFQIWISGGDYLYEITYFNNGYLVEAHVKKLQVGVG